VTTPGGRYQILFSPLARADTFLLDTETGKVWQLTKFTDANGEPLAWVPMDRLDSQADWAAFFATHKVKQNSSVAPSPAAASTIAPAPKAARNPPMLLNRRPQ
jgi:hypothetical protein